MAAVLCWICNKTKCIVVDKKGYIKSSSWYRREGKYVYRKESTTAI